MHLNVCQDGNHPFLVLQGLSVQGNNISSSPKTEFQICFALSLLLNVTWHGEVWLRISKLCDDTETIFVNIFLSHVQM